MDGRPGGSVRDALMHAPRQAPIRTPAEPRAGLCYDELTAIDVTQMARSRTIPRIGDPVTVVFLGARLGGVVTLVDDSGRRLSVQTDDGEAHSFALSRATGNFHKDGQQSAARLVFGDA
jgi:hypothetical protein